MNYEMNELEMSALYIAQLESEKMQMQAEIESQASLLGLDLAIRDGSARGR